MQIPSTPATSPKSSSSSSHSSPSVRRVVRCGQPQPYRLQTEIIAKPPTKEQKKPLEMKLHTKERAIKRAGFNDLVASKINYLERQRLQEERLQKMIEEEEVRMLRKELIPRAQLMPLFDRPFFPQRSRKPLTVPREPSFNILNNRCWRCMSCNELYAFHQPLHQNINKSIK